MVNHICNKIKLLGILKKLLFGYYKMVINNKFQFLIIKNIDILDIIQIYRINK
jgi:hypothetical protein